MDAIAQFKEQQKLIWAGFGALEAATTSVAPRLVRFAGVQKGSEVLDVACGTGVVALTAARLGAKVTGLDLTPELIAQARENGALAQLEVSWHQGDVEALPLPDARFDVVLSQFGHMFAPRPEVALGEMLRVLKPGGIIAFSTWPPEMFVGRTFALLGKYGPPPPPGVSPPVSWGDPQVVRERLGGSVRDLTFGRDAMIFPVLSVQHYRTFMERNFALIAKVIAGLQSADPRKAELMRRELEELAAQYFHDNNLRQDYLLTRAIKL